MAALCDPNRDDIPTQLSEPGFVGNSSNANIQHLLPARSSPDFSHLGVASILQPPPTNTEHQRRCNDETAIHLGVVSHSARSPSVDCVPGDSICAVADALGILRNHPFLSSRSGRTLCRDSVLPFRLSRCSQVLRALWGCGHRCVLLPFSLRQRLSLIVSYRRLPRN